jgi:hypothetical protein
MTTTTTMAEPIPFPPFFPWHREPPTGGMSFAFRREEGDRKRKRETE